VLEREAARSRVWAIGEAQLAEVVLGGATARQVAERLGTDPRETERRLDDLVARDVLALDVSGEGDLSYRPPDTTA
jgi:predicted ArsR family transcriptional regulator